MIRVIDNYLNQEDFLRIKNTLGSSDFPWYYQKNINDSHSEKNLDCYFTHYLFNQKNGQSSFYYIIKPILNKLNVKALIRIKSNLYPRTEKLEIHKPHSDYTYKHKGAIFYINTNDGKTILNKNKEIDSVENRLLLFEPHLSHSSTSTTNVKSRININFNYF